MGGRVGEEHEPSHKGGGINPNQPMGGAQKCQPTHITPANLRNKLAVYFDIIIIYKKHINLLENNLYK